MNNSGLHWNICIFIINTLIENTILVMKNFAEVCHTVWLANVWNVFTLHLHCNLHSRIESELSMDVIYVAIVAKNTPTELLVSH